MPNIALLYDDDAYVEPTRDRAGRPEEGRAAGLMGRQVAGRSFLDAYLGHGDWSTLVAVVRRREAAGGLVATCRDHPSSRSRARRLRVVEESRLLEEFDGGAEPAARLIHAPCPPDPRHAWARRADAYALCGVTHTTCSAGAMARLSALVTAPFEPYDALVCTSRAVEATVRAVGSAVADDLRARFGGEPRLRPRLEVIPLGVDVDRHRPPTPPERAAARARLGIGDGEVAVLFVGRLSHHAKAHPFPLYRGVAAAAEATGRPIRLLMAGWAANPAMFGAFVEGARAFAGGARVDFLDGVDPAVRAGVWHAADLFASPSDSLQETFGLTIVEAMASGLPVVASDWSGYRDLVDHGVSGLLAPTIMAAGVPEDAAARLVLGGDYDAYLAEVGQATAVDPDAFAAAIATLAADADLRRAMGAAGRSIARARFAWPGIIRAYESLWADQEAGRRSIAASRPAPRSPACYPPPDRSFAAYPTRWLAESDRLVAAPTAAVDLAPLLSLPLTHHGADRRSAEAGPILALIAAASAGRPFADLAAECPGLGIAADLARPTIAWMIKYGLLRLVDR